VEILEVYVSHF